MDASISGDRKTLKFDAFIPVTMAVIYLLLLLYFKTIGGYRPVKIEEARRLSGAAAAVARLASAAAVRGLGSV